MPLPAVSTSTSDEFVMPGDSPDRPFPPPGFGPLPGITFASRGVTPAASKRPSLIRTSRFHLQQVDESYWKHLRAASRFSFRLVKAGAACALHALVPGLCTRSASRAVAELHAELMQRADGIEQLRMPHLQFHRCGARHIEIKSS